MKVLTSVVESCDTTVLLTDRMKNYENQFVIVLETRISMRILVVSDSTKDNVLGKRVEDKILHSLQERNCHYVHHHIEKDAYKPCIGCFNCWVKTPGSCILKDGISEVTEDFIKSDAILIITQIRYGCYSPDIKRLLDRSIPNILPFFKMINNEMHHAPRYSKYPELFMIGYGDDITVEEAETFRELANANGINMQKGGAGVYICRNGEDISKLADNLRSDLKLSREAVV